MQLYTSVGRVHAGCVWDWWVESEAAIEGATDMLSLSGGREAWEVSNNDMPLTCAIRGDAIHYVMPHTTR